MMDVTVGTIIVAGITAAASLGLGLMNRLAHNRTTAATEVVRWDANARLSALNEHVGQLQDEVARLKREADLSKDLINELKADLRECLREREVGDRERLALLQKLIERRAP